MFHKYILPTGLAGLVMFAVVGAVNTANSQQVVMRPSCVKYDDVGFSLSAELKSPYREMLLTPQARQAGIRVYRGGGDANIYGGVSLAYYDSNATCIVWMETITPQEYAIRLGLEPYDVSPFYSREAEKPVAAAPVSK